MIFMYIYRGVGLLLCIVYRQIKCDDGMDLARPCSKESMDKILTTVNENNVMIKELRQQLKDQKSQIELLQQNIRVSFKRIHHLERNHRLNIRRQSLTYNNQTSINNIEQRNSRSPKVDTTVFADDKKIKGSLMKESKRNASYKKKNYYLATQLRVEEEDMSRMSHIPVYGRERRDVGIQNSSFGNTPVAFSASVSVTPTDLGREHTIPFDKVSINHGNAFDPVTHVFECPLHGVYFFHTALSSVYHDYIETELVKDGVVLARLYAAGDTRDFPFGFDQGANAILTECNEGEHVWVRVREHVGKALSTGEFTTFVGFLLYTV